MVAVAIADTEPIVVTEESAEAEVYQWWQVQAVVQSLKDRVIADFLNFPD